MRTRIAGSIEKSASFAIRVAVSSPTLCLVRSPRSAMLLTVCCVGRHAVLSVRQDHVTTRRWRSPLHRPRRRDPAMISIGTACVCLRSWKRRAQASAWARSGRVGRGEAVGGVGHHPRRAGKGERNKNMRGEKLPIVAMPSSSSGMGRFF